MSKRSNWLIMLVLCNRHFLHVYPFVILIPCIFFCIFENLIWFGSWLYLFPLLFFIIYIFNIKVKEKKEFCVTLRVMSTLIQLYSLSFITLKENNYNHVLRLYHSNEYLCHFLHIHYCQILYNSILHILNYKFIWLSFFNWHSHLSCFIVLQS